MEIARSIIDLISSLLILGGIIYGICFFKHKTDSSVRNLYIRNLKKLDNIFVYFFSYGNINEDMRHQLFNVYEEASLYLHKDIVKYIEKVKDLIFECEILGYKLNDLPIGDERSKICQRQCDIKIELYNMAGKGVSIYRKQIVQDGFIPKTMDRFSDFCKEINKYENPNIGNLNIKN